MTALPATDPDLAPIHYPTSDGWRISDNAPVSEAIRHTHASQRISPINPTSHRHHQTGRRPPSTTQTP